MLQCRSVLPFYEDLKEMTLIIFSTIREQQNGQNGQENYRHDGFFEKMPRVLAPG